MRGLPSYPNPRLGEYSLPPGVPAANLWYRFCRFSFGLMSIVLWQLEVFNRHFEPAEGAALYISNHQSFLDPALMALSLKRPVNFMARESLFGIPGFGALISSLKAFPVRRGAADIGAMKQALRLLKRREQLVVFAEGTRTGDGRIGPFLPGVALLARRAAEWIVPTVIEGAFDVYPRGTSLPTFEGRIVVAYCPPIHRDQAQGRDARELLADVRDRMIATQADLRRRLGKPPLIYDCPAPDGARHET